MGGFEPAASAGHGGMERSKEDDADYGFESARRKLLGAGNEIAGGVVDQDVERSGFPNGVDHGLYCVETADVAGEGMDWAFGRGGEFGGGLLENFFATAADVDGGSELEEAAGHRFAESGAAAGDEDALVAEEVVAEHSW